MDCHPFGSLCAIACFLTSAFFQRSIVFFICAREQRSRLQPNSESQNNLISRSKISFPSRKPIPRQITCFPTNFYDSIVPSKIQHHEVCCFRFEEMKQYMERLTGVLCQKSLVRFTIAMDNWEQYQKDLPYSIDLQVRAREKHLRE